jgi:hypothetical protein
LEQVDAAIVNTFPGEQCFTGLFAELDLATGHLTWHSADTPARRCCALTRVVKV